MAEYTNASTARVEAGQNLALTETPICGSPCIVHREGAGIVTLRGMTNQCRARYFVDFVGNVAIPTGGTVGSISVALTINGEPLNSAVAIVTPAAVENYFNVSVSAFVDVPRGCCVTAALKNTSAQAIYVANANLIVTRQA